MQFRRRFGLRFSPCFGLCLVFAPRLSPACMLCTLTAECDSCMNLKLSATISYSRPQHLLICHLRFSCGMLTVCRWPSFPHALHTYTHMRLCENLLHKRALIARVGQYRCGQKCAADGWRGGRRGRTFAAICCCCVLLGS